MDARTHSIRFLRHAARVRTAGPKAVALLAIAPAVALAQGFGGADAKVCGFFDNVNGLLNMASIAVVTIAMIFAGYQIAFAHKRISDVAPILVGGLLIGAAAQIARMLLGPEAGECTAMLGTALPVFHA
ncbi:TrbC/VirB2 family protein [Luteimonas sp. MJ250]|uniref:TrbC/VirB2 family protein n=1 Tax=Luteimonas sp. MJ250 TaxID=3129236 RepID=UPI0031BA8114